MHFNKSVLETILLEFVVEEHVRALINKLIDRDIDFQYHVKEDGFNPTYQIYLHQHEWNYLKEEGIVVNLKEEFDNIQYIVAGGKMYDLKEF